MCSCWTWVSNPCGTVSKYSFPKPHIKQLLSIFVLTFSSWSRSSPNASMIKPMELRYYNIYKYLSLHTRFTLNNSEKNNDDKKEECNIKHDTINFVIITIWFSNFVTDTTTGSYTFVQMKNETLKEDNIVLIPLCIICKHLIHILLFPPLTCRDISCLLRHLPLEYKIF